MRTWTIDRGTIAVVVDFGEADFHRYQIKLGAPAARYFRPGGGEVARQWRVRRRANARLFLRLKRMLAGTGALVQVTRRQAA